MSQKCIKGAVVEMKDHPYNVNMDRVGLKGKIIDLQGRFVDPRNGRVCRYEIEFDDGDTDYFQGWEFDVLVEAPVNMEDS